LARLRATLTHCFAENDRVDFEVIVVNDGSTDGTRNYLEQVDDTRIRSIHQNAQGAQAARNKGMDAANGQYVKFLDDDDRLAPGTLRREFEALRDTSAQVSYGTVRIEWKNGEVQVVEPDEQGDLVMGLMRDRVAAHPHAFLYHRKALRGIQWDESLQYYQDTDFAFRVASHGIPTVRLPETVALHYVHDGDRISDRKQDAPVVEQQRRRVETILRSLRTLEENDALRPGHRVAAAEGIWRWAYMAAPYDFSFFRKSVEKAETIYPGFRPDRGQPILEWLDRHIGPQQTEALINPLRRAKRYLYA
jgi:glycosyltransferase involved in cell wall biosynthesis